MKMKRKKKVLQVPKLESLKQINPNAAGVDVGASELYVCVPEDRDPRPVRVFQTFTSDLHEIAAWLKRCRVTSVARNPPVSIGFLCMKSWRKLASRSSWSMPEKPKICRVARATFWTANGFNSCIAMGS